MQPNGLSQRRLLLQVRQDGALKGYRMLDLHRDYPPLRVELGCKAVAARPDLQNAPWVMNAAVPGGRAASEIQFEARSADAGDVLASLNVPVQHFAWMGEEMAASLKLAGTYSLLVSPVADNSRLLDLCADDDGSDDFELFDADPEVHLPSGFIFAEPGARKRVRDAGTWLRCLFSPGAYRDFLRAAEEETGVERAWAAAARGVHLTRAGCWVVIDELVPVPAAESGHSFIRTTGTQTYALFQRLGGQCGAYLHTHPAEIEDRGERVALAPVPSGNDSVLAWNLCSSRHTPVVLPIAISGPARSRNIPRLQTHGYERGILREISLEVLLK